jgi:hypothetical protein
MFSFIKEESHNKNMNMFKLKNLLPSNSFCLERFKLFGLEDSLEQTTVGALDIIFVTVNLMPRATACTENVMKQILDCFMK